MKHKILTIAALAAIPFMFSANAQARDYCREYTKTIRIGGKIEVGYGEACRRDGGVWEIVKLGGPEPAREKVRERIYDDLYDRDTRIVIVDRYYAPYGHYYKARRYYSSYYPRYYGHPHYSAFFYFSDNDRHDKMPAKHKRAHENAHKKYHKKH